MSTLVEILKNAFTMGRQYPEHRLGEPILSIAGLEVEFESGPALVEVTFELEQGERLAVVGPNGAGKSTLFKVIAGIIRPTRGEVFVYGHEPVGHICIAYIPQRSQVDWQFPVDVADVVMMGRISKLGLLRWPTASDWENVHQALETVGMAHLAHRQINQLSGGQQQRMFIARALAQEAELMLMDEPFTGLDARSMEEVFIVLEELRQRAVTVMVALHDLQVAAQRFDRVMLLNQRLLGLGNPADILNAASLLAAYGSHLHLVETEAGTLVLEDTCCEEGTPVHD